jgi:threonine synthase
MNNVTGFKCVECSRSFSVGEIEYICPACGGNLDALYDYERVGRQLSKATLAADRNFTIWRYRALLPIEDSSLAPP